MMRELAPGCLWTDYEPMSVAGMPFGRRAAVASRTNGDWIVFSPLQATASGIALLRSIGPIAGFVVPSRFHDRFYEDYFEPFKGTPFWATRGVMDNHPAWPLTELTPDSTALAGFDFELIAGMPGVQETVFVHRASRTLIVADALFNIPRSGPWFGQLMMRLADIGGTPRPSRLFRSMIKDRRAFARSLHRILSFDFDRIVPGHGQIIDADAKAVFREAFKAYLA